MTITAPLFFERPPAPSPSPGPTQGPRGCDIEVATQINIPFALTPEMLTEKRHGNEDLSNDMGSLAITSVSVSVKFAGGSHTVYPNNVTPVPPADATPAPPADVPSPPTASVHPPAEAVPAPDETFIIRDPGSGRVICTTGPEVRLADMNPDSQSSHWICFENNGWLGFRNRASGMVLGHNGKGGFHAKVEHHKSHEWFQVRRHPDGGYLLLVRYKDHLRRVAVGGDGEALVEKKDGGVRWEFVKV